MNSNERKFFENLCKMCISNYQVLNNADMISTLISQVCRIKDMDVPFVKGILYVEVNNYKRQYAHCFNMYMGNVIDAGIYQFAIMNKKIEELFPMYIAGNEPNHIEYKVMSEVKLDAQFKFKREFLIGAIEKAYQYDNVEINKFNEIEDSKKSNLFYYR